MKPCQRRTVAKQAAKGSFNANTWPNGYCPQRMHGRGHVAKHLHWFAASRSKVKTPPDGNSRKILEGCRKTLPVAAVPWLLGLRSTNGNGQTLCGWKKMCVCPSVSSEPRAHPQQKQSRKIQFPQGITLVHASSSRSTTAKHTNNCSFDHRHLVSRRTLGVC